MKIKYKLILIFIFIIIVAALPLSMFILEKQEKGKTDLLKHNGKINSRVLSLSGVNILLMNGGDIASSRVDSREMISIIRPLANDGLIYGDIILLSSNEKYNGIVLGSYVNDDFLNIQDYNKEKIVSEELSRLKGHSGFREITFPGIGGICYEFTSESSVSGKPPICLGRLIFSKSVIMAPVKRLRMVIYIATVSVILIVSFLGIYFSRIISRPIAELTSGVERIEAGNMDYRIPIKRRDEFGKLAKTFNDLMIILSLEIKELVTTNKKLTRLDQLKDEFLANISHELRSPLNSSIEMAESLVHGAAGPLSSEAIHDLLLIINSGRNLSQLVNDILDFSRLKHRDVELDLVSVDMQAVTQLVISILMPLIEKKSLLIHNDIAVESVYVYGDKNKLQQVLLNLIGNAAKYTDKGEIRVSAGYSIEDPDKIVITVEDSGIGIEHDRKERIFESFEQAKGTAVPGYGTAGLGLAITKKLIELHSGDIWVESELQKGSRFSFSLIPYKGIIKNSVEEKNKQEMYIELMDLFDKDIRQQKKIDEESQNRFISKILVVDDDAVNLQILINHLHLEGHEVVVAGNGNEALDKIEKGKLPGLIILDVMLPGISGYEVCRIIREKYSLYELPVLMLTSMNKPGDVVTGLEAGANDYLLKPLNRKELLARVHNLISLKNSVQLNNELNIIKRDIHIAHRIQQSLLPQEIPDMENIKIAVRYIPMESLGGDFYDFPLIDNDKLGILIADVSGHGIPAAFINSMLKVAYSFHHEEATMPDQYFNSINSTMFKYTHDQFITAGYVYINFSEQRIYQANAGHWPLLVWRREEQRLITKRDAGMPFGWVPDEKYNLLDYELKPGDRLLLYTDGIIESKSREGEMYGEDNFYKLLEKNQNLNAEEFADHIISTVRKWSGITSEESFSDDVMIIIIDISI